MATRKKGGRRRTLAGIVGDWFTGPLKELLMLFFEG